MTGSPIGVGTPRRFTGEMGSGAHLDTDEVFLAGGKDAESGNIVALRK